MNQDQVQEFASQNSLDVRVIAYGRQNKPNHIRLMDSWGNYVTDVYFKHTKSGINKSYNRVFHHKTHRWGEVHNEQELKQFINQ